MNITGWTPYEARGKVRGIAGGLPATGAARIDGLAIGLGGVAAEDRRRGIAIAPMARAPASGGVDGITIAGLGVGSGGRP